MSTAYGKRQNNTAYISQCQNNNFNLIIVIFTTAGYKMSQKREAKEWG